MKTPIDLSQLGQNIVYLKPVATDSLPAEVQEQAGTLDTIFAVHNGEGQQVAFVADRAIASHLAAKNKMQLATVH